MLQNLPFREMSEKDIQEESETTLSLLKQTERRYVSDDIRRYVGDQTILLLMTICVNQQRQIDDLYRKIATLADPEHQSHLMLKDLQKLS